MDESKIRVEEVFMHRWVKILTEGEGSEGEKNAWEEWEGVGVCS